MQYLIGLFFGIGLYLILADHFRVPYFATSSAMLRVRASIVALLAPYVICPAKT